MNIKLPSRNIPPLGEAYRRARRAYGLTSAILMAWELVGIQLGGVPVEHVRLWLKSPEAALYMLIALILYFGVRLSIEWYQNDIRRRELPASRRDFVMSHTIAIAAVALYGFQTFAGLQLADIVTVKEPLIFIVVILFSLLIDNCIRRWRRDQNAKLPIIGLIIYLLIASWLVYELTIHGIFEDRSLVFLGIAGIPASLLLRWLVSPARFRQNL
ncbi:MAG: hypothetical protein ABJB09_06865 [Verrucomicrobiota bacterium]